MGRSTLVFIICALVALQSGLVVACPTGCSSCSGSYCTACFTGYYLTIYNTCSSCMNGCQSCRQYPVCDTCKSSYYLQNGNCFSCTSNCASCTDGFSCLRCNGGYYLDNAQRYCNSCVSNCASCTGPNQCSSCSSTYNKVSGPNGDECHASIMTYVMWMIFGLLFIICLPLIICCCCVQSCRNSMGWTNTTNNVDYYSQEPSYNNHFSHGHPPPHPSNFNHGHPPPHPSNFAQPPNNMGGGVMPPPHTQGNSGMPW